MKACWRDFMSRPTTTEPDGADLFDYIGRSLRISEKHLDQELIDRIIDFFDWRHDVAEPLELKKFTFWLEAECLDPDWRLQSYLKILDLGQGSAGEISLQVKYLTQFLPEFLALVVECFAKITDFMNQGIQIHIPTDAAKAILEAGLKAEDQEIQKNAERARENLLRSYNPSLVALLQYAALLLCAPLSRIFRV